MNLGQDDMKSGLENRLFGRFIGFFFPSVSKDFFFNLHENEKIGVVLVELDAGFAYRTDAGRSRASPNSPPNLTWQPLGRALNSNRCHQSKRFCPALFVQEGGS